MSHLSTQLNTFDWLSSFLYIFILSLFVDKTVNTFDHMFCPCAFVFINYLVFVREKKVVDVNNDKIHRSIKLALDGCMDRSW